MITKRPIHSMTGFSSVEGQVAGTRMRIELKALNHRFLDIKIRLPREFSSAEMPLRTIIQNEFSRGSIEVKVERVMDMDNSVLPSQLNLPLAAHYYENLITLQKTLGLSDSVKFSDLLALPDVISKTASESQIEEGWLKLEPLAKASILKMREMRVHEGQALVGILAQALDEMEERLGVLRAQREKCEKSYRSRIREKIQTVFEAYPIAESSVHAVLESRIAQELAMIIDRTDIEEELNRFKGHLDHFKKILSDGGAAGRKLDFILQEMNREINTLGNKAQDLTMSQETVAVKVLIEQLREQVMNLE